MAACRPAHLLLAVAVAGVCLIGCGPPPSNYAEIVQPDDILVEGDLLRLLGVLEALDDAARARLPVPFIAAPAWSAERTLPVWELLEEDAEAHERAWSATATADLLPAGPDWETLLATHRLSRPQFCGLLLAVGTAVARAQTDRQLDLAFIAARGLRELEPLHDDERPFATLTPEEQYRLVRRAQWLTIADRAARLTAVPDDTSNLVARFQQRLSATLPAAYQTDPLAGLYPRREDLGLPFEEGELSDADLTWDRANAVIGTDAPPAMTP